MSAINLNAASIRAEIDEAPGAHDLTPTQAQIILALTDEQIEDAIQADDHFWDAFYSARRDAISRLASAHPATAHLGVLTGIDGVHTSGPVVLGSEAEAEGAVVAALIQRQIEAGADVRDGYLNAPTDEVVDLALAVASRKHGGQARRAVYQWVQDTPRFLGDQELALDALEVPAPRVADDDEAPRAYRGEVKDTKTGEVEVYGRVSESLLGAHGAAVAALLSRWAGGPLDVQGITDDTPTPEQIRAAVDGDEGVRRAVGKWERDTAWVLENQGLEVRAWRFD